ncbi:MAG: hypothetical protein A3D31_17605 [Candidatus Fluviicola riflensis]|nr:MAG: hypothetical protein CHH17_02545 [Candidatus Fluviicola riflensis]OGS76801.1 MAG: hypothetical protein A3D31_17605 [Candidatus Fluviicola riflensis]OGS82844.1 MAG: hypothetical protein A2724_13755 [Fluviicola sp. RIFCSPHIGHO2_01_FULL_43_53]OGS88531.1 MAG: hypothetical protein A3E30_07110 [Fluviicola sp. RIFCSPHIGHO2_12_FULL_43_24]
MKTFRVLLILTIVSTTVASILVFQDQNEKPHIKEGSKNKTTQNSSQKSVYKKTKHLKNVENQK